MTEIDFTDVISCELDAACASDLSVVNAARISFDHENPSLQENDDKLISFLVRNRHGSPFEHNLFRFKVEAPIFTFREHHRHRVGHSYNEMSGRYTELEPKFYIPKAARVQHGKPGAYFFVEEEPDSNMSVFLDGELRDAYEHAWWSYERLLKSGIAKEQARMVLPVGIFTKMIWTCNARSLMHFIGLRAEKTAQQEIQMVARAAEKALCEHMPLTYKAFVDNGRIAP